LSQNITQQFVEYNYALHHILDKSTPFIDNDAYSSITNSFLTKPYYAEIRDEYKNIDFVDNFIKLTNNVVTKKYIIKNNFATFFEFNILVGLSSFIMALSSYELLEKIADKRYFEPQTKELLMLYNISTQPMPTCQDYAAMLPKIEL